MMTCPKCNYERNPSDIECPKCGVVYKKYEDYIAKKQIEIEKETNKKAKFNTEQAEALGTQPPNSQIEEKDEIPKKDKSRKKLSQSEINEIYESINKEFRSSSSSHLIRCPDCGKDVSCRANSCPHCGAPINLGEKVIQSTKRILPQQFTVNIEDTS